MKPDKGSVGSLFSTDTQYIVPLYQRAYVWSEEHQWEPLWEDILELLEEFHEKPDSKKNHFMGSLVLKQQDNLPASEPQKREVIDGQQRLTTCQILFAALLRSTSDKTLTEKASLINRLKKCIINEDFDGDYRFKLQPAHQDKPALKAVIDYVANASPISYEVQDEKLVLAFNFFVQRFDAWIGANEDAGDRFETAFNVIHRCLVFILLILEEGDSAQLIFETLNARGTPLLQADLVKNYVLHQADLSEDSSKDLHAKFWAQFEDRDESGEWWRSEIKIGRLMRTQLDAFLQFYVGLKSMAEVSPASVFENIKELTPKSDENSLSMSPRGLLAEVGRYGKLYFEMGHSRPDSREAVFFERLRILDFMTAYPLLLKLKEATGTNNEGYLEALDVLESYLVRRMICKLTPKSYNKTLYNLVKDINATDPAGSLKSKLLSFEDDTVKWPNDDLFQEALCDSSFFNRITRARLRMILSAINSHFQAQDSLAEAVPRPGLVPEVEHVLPQKWQQNWPVGEEDAENRQRHVHQLGNLVLVTKKLNLDLSNLAWQKKKEILADSAVFVTTRKIVSGDWNEEKISERTRLFADAAGKIWGFG